MSEAAVIQAIQKILTRRGCWWLNIHGSVYGRRGLPDILAVHKGRCLAIEAKRPGGQPTRLQQHELRRARAAGAIALCTSDPAQVKAILDAIDDATGDPTP